MEAVLETTKWFEPWVPNHTYLLQGMKVLAYIKQGTKTPIWLKTPLPFYRGGRTFKSLYRNPFGLQKQDADVLKVKGSHGELYEVNKVEKTCTCPGYMYRGKCKHVEQLEVF